MKKLVIKLKQHTPLIHFQHDQQGATLRASEVKPKLDRFILEKLGNGDRKKGEAIAKERNWLIGSGERKALNYKLRIDASEVEKWSINSIQQFTQKHAMRNREFIQVGNNKYLAKRRKMDSKLICDLKQYPSFFANLDADFFNPNEYRKFSFTEQPICLTFSFKDIDTSIYELLNDGDLLSDFFFQNNFGTRQTKGFGSFMIDENDPLYRPKRSKYRFTLDAYKWDCETINDEYQKVYEIVDLFYKTLRGGINLKNREGHTLFYFKSLSFKYADDKLKANWDKRKIKEEFYHIERNGRPSIDMRDMLGFSTNEQWLSYKDNITKESNVADRMRSPILFKILYNDQRGQYFIHILLQDDHVNMSDFKRGTVKVTSRRHGHFNIDLPQSFSTESFFNYIFNELRIDISEHVEGEYQGHYYFDILDNIYSQIKNNL